MFIIIIIMIMIIIVITFTMPADLPHKALKHDPIMVVEDMPFLFILRMLHTTYQYIYNIIYYCNDSEQYTYVVVYI